MESMMRVLKEATCPSNSGKSTLTYQIGCDEKEQIYYRISKSSGGGYFSAEWVSLKSILALLEDRQGPITGYTLQPLFQGKSINTSYFLLAGLLDMGIVERWKRTYKLTGIDYEAEMKALIASNSDVTPKKKRTPKKKKTPTEPAPTPL